MNVLWVKDNNIGHEKQVDVLLKELSKKLNLKIDSRIVKNSFLFQKKIDNVKSNYYDILIGAGHKTHSILLKNKKNQKKTTKVIAILSPTFYKSQFDIICTPSHDKHKFNSKDNVIFYEGSLVTVSLKETREDVVMIAIGGKNKHYIFDQDHIYDQMEYFLSINSNKHCYIFNSRRTPREISKKISSQYKDNERITFVDFYDNRSNISIEEIMHQSQSKLITRDSVNMVYESLSCKGDTYLFDMHAKRGSTKVVENINMLIKNRKIGFVDCSELTQGFSKMKLEKQNIHNDVFAEVEKVAYEIQNKL
mgnify:FL=1